MLEPDLNIGFIGGGNMAQAIISGLVKQGHRRDRIVVSAPSQSTRDALSRQYHVRTERDNTVVADIADVLVMAVKPNQIGEVCMQINDALEETQQQKLVISIAAGVTHQFISDNLGGSQRVICAMPNLPTAICKGLTGLYTDQACAVHDIQTADDLMNAIGETVWVDDESQMPAIVAAAGSSPAYFFLFMEAMEKAAIEQGLSPDVAKSSVLQSALGAVSMAIRSELPLSELRDRVTSPKGSTERAVQALNDGQIHDIVANAMRSAANRVDELYRQH